MPSGFDSISTSPERPPDLRNTLSGCTTPCTASPKIGSGLRIVWPPATVPPASATTSRRGFEDRRDRVAREVLGERGDVHRHGDPPAHREHVAARVGGGDGAEVRRVIDERREEVGRRHQRDVVGEPVDRRVVERSEPDEQRRVGRRGEVGDEILQQRGAPFRRAPSARRPFGEPEIVEAGSPSASESASSVGGRWWSRSCHVKLTGSSAGRASLGRARRGGLRRTVRRCSTPRRSPAP